MLVRSIAVALAALCCAAAASAAAAPKPHIVYALIDDWGYVLRRAS